MPVRVLASAAETRALGRRLGRLAGPGTVIALVGELGAGKTWVAGGIGRALGVRGPIPSPTFVLCLLHEGGRLPFAHADLYRLADRDEAEAAGLGEILAGDGVAAIEWADRVPDLLPPDHLRVEIRLVPGRPRAREVEVRATGPRHRHLEEALGA